MSTETSTRLGNLKHGDIFSINSGTFEVVNIPNEGPCSVLCRESQNYFKGVTYQLGKDVAVKRNGHYTVQG
jgi:hypothetical protein